MTTRSLGSRSWKSLGITLATSASLLLSASSYAAASCEEIRNQYPTPPMDGTYSLTLGGHSVEVYCHDMAGTPREYLSLPHTGETTNYSSYGVGPNTSPTGQTTWFSKVRFNPEALTLTLTDTTFSTSQGWFQIGQNITYAQPLADAGDCVGDNSQTGRSNIDLTGTPLGIAPDQFQVFGWMAAGSATYNGTQLVDLQGGGYCGNITAPNGVLQLTWQPSTCAEIRQQDPTAADGDYLLTLGSRVVQVYCHDMAGTPREYLTLPLTGGSYNYSYYGKGQNTSSTGLTTRYTKVRFNPGDLTIDAKDTTFSQSSGWKRFGSNYGYTNRYASAGDCVNANSKTGRANIDLTGLPFAVVPNQFQTTGWMAAGSASYSGSQIVNLQGGGYCGDHGSVGGILYLSWLE